MPLSTNPFGKSVYGKRDKEAKDALMEQIEHLRPKEGVEGSNPFGFAFFIKFKRLKNA